MLRFCTYGLLPCFLCNVAQVGGSIIFIVAYWARRWTGRDRKDGSGGALQRAPSGSTHGGMAMGGAGAMPMMGSVKSFYSSDPTGSEVEIAIQPGSARYAGGQMVMPPVGDGELRVAAGLQGEQGTSICADQQPLDEAQAACAHVACSASRCRITAVIHTHGCRAAYG